MQSGGGKALYSGLLGNLAGVIPASAIFMGIYEPAKQYLEQRVPKDKQFLGALGGGASAGLVASLVRVPTEVIKQRMQTGKPLSRSPSSQCRPPDHLLPVMISSVDTVFTL